MRRRVGRLLTGANGSTVRADAGAPSILESYVRSAPSARNAIDIFKGDWSSRFPPPLESATGGQSPLFEDERIRWMLEQFGGVSGQRVLELGPLEGGHTYMLHRAGAASITAIESNTRAYLRCLIVKELFDLRNARFLCGDLMEYLRGQPPHVDLCVASGVLYHMVNPAELIDRCAAVADRLLLWTHYYDADVVAASDRLRAEFSSNTKVTYQGFAHTLYQHHYTDNLGWTGFCGGSTPSTNWMSREEILACLQHFGWRTKAIAFDARDHPNGPSFALVAEKS